MAAEASKESSKTEGASPAPAVSQAPAPAAEGGKKRPAPPNGAGDSKRQRADLSVGDRGVFFTTTSPGGAGNAKRDLLRLLEAAMEDGSSTSAPEQSGGESAGARLEAELKELKAKKPTLVSCSEVAKGTGFLKFVGDADALSPTEVVSKMLEAQRADFQANRMSVFSRLLCRVLPIDHTCKPFIDDFRKLAQEVLPPHVGPEAEATVWALEFKARNTNTLKKEAVLQVVDEIIPKGRHKVSINDPAKCILVEVNPLFCGLSVVPHWAKLKKYNLSALTTPEDPKKAAPAAAKVGSQAQSLGVSKDTATTTDS